MKQCGTAMRTPMITLRDMSENIKLQQAPLLYVPRCRSKMESPVNSEYSHRSINQCRRDALAVGEHYD